MTNITLNGKQKQNEFQNLLYLITLHNLERISQRIELKKFTAKRYKLTIFLKYENISFRQERQFSKSENVLRLQNKGSSNWSAEASNSILFNTMNVLS